MAETISVDVSDLLDIPISSLETLILDLDASAPGTEFVLDVVRYVAVLAMCGVNMPSAMSREAVFRRGAAMLEISLNFTQKARPRP